MTNLYMTSHRQALGFMGRSSKRHRLQATTAPLSTHIGISHTHCQLPNQATHLQKQRQQVLDPNKLRSVSKKNLLSDRTGGYVVAPSSCYEEVGTIALKPDAFWIKSILTLPDGDDVDQAHVTSHQNP